MGADFLFDTIVIKKGKDLKELEGQLIALAKALPLDSFTPLDRERILNTFDVEVTSKNFAKVKMLMIDTIKDAFVTLKNRECSYMTFKGYHIHLTGGMSWGEAPTDAYDTFNRFNALPSCLHKLLT
jgi:hypothetical protein